MTFTSVVLIGSNKALLELATDADVEYVITSTAVNREVEGIIAPEVMVSLPYHP